jgi:hypothetical protein
VSVKGKLRDESSAGSIRIRFETASQSHH